jgi:ribosomal protein S18 acetylase RimI-like enzyme
MLLRKKAKTLTIREAKLEDAYEIALTQTASWVSAYKALVTPERLYSQSLQKRFTSWQKRLQDPQFSVLIAEHPSYEGVAGFCALQTPSNDADATPDIAQISALYVHPSCWRLGIGRELLKHTTERLHQQISEITLWVISANEDALAFYDSCGWKADGKSKKLPVRANEPEREAIRLSFISHTPTYW